MPEIIDFDFTDHGSVTLIKPLTEAARAYADESFGDDALTFGGAIACEPRFAPGIAADLYFEQGFAVAINGRSADAERQAA